jgi:hypothetical protein
MHLLELAKLNAYRHFHRKDQLDALADFVAFASAVERITASDQEQDEFRTAVRDDWPKVEGTWCDLPATFARAMATDGATSQMAEAKLWEKFRTYRRDVQGDLTYRRAIYCHGGSCRACSPPAAGCHEIGGFVG